MTEYKLLYWPSLPGRGEFVRVVLEDADAAYLDVARAPEADGGGFAAVRGWLAGHGPGFPVFAPPVLLDGELVIAQMPNVCAFVGERHGLAPAGAGARAQAMTLMLTIADVVSEVHDTHHPISTALRYEEQKDAALQRTTAFVTVRLPRWIGFFERVLERGDGRHTIGTDTSYVDLALQQLLRGLRHAFPTAFGPAIRDAARLRALGERVEARPRLAAYRASPRCIPFNLDGIFRAYPELDLAPGA